MADEKDLKTLLDDPATLDHLEAEMPQAMAQAAAGGGPVLRLVLSIALEVLRRLLERTGNTPPVGG